MIMIFIPVVIELLNEYYDRFLESRELKKALKNWACTCGWTGGLHRYGGYDRPYISNGQTEILWVQRIRCSYCGKTHALLPAHLIPYSRTPAEVKMQIVLAMGKKEKQEQIMAVYPDLEERDFRRIRRDYHKSWESRISLEELKKRFASLTPAWAAAEITRHCLISAGKQFMQRCGEIFSFYTAPTSLSVTEGGKRPKMRSSGRNQ
jgi:hypothetical protein